MCSTMPWRHCTSLLSARSEPPPLEEWHHGGTATSTPRGRTVTGQGVQAHLNLSSEPVVVPPPSQTVF